MQRWVCYIPRIKSFKPLVLNPAINVLLGLIACDPSDANVPWSLRTVLAYDPEF